MAGIALISLLFGIAGAVAGHVLWRYLRTYNAPSKTFGKWTHDLESTATELVRAELYVAELQAALASKLEKVPDDFVAPIFVAARLGVAIERAVLSQAESQGLIPPGAYERLVVAGGAVRLQEAFETASGPQTPPEVPGAREGQETAPAPASFPAMWKGGKLVPFRRAGGN